MTVFLQKPTGYFCRMDFREKTYTFSGLDDFAGFRHGKAYELERGTTYAQEAGGQRHSIGWQQQVLGFLLSLFMALPQRPFIYQASTV